LIDENNGIVAGHCRAMAAKKLKLEEVPCIELTGLTEAQRKAYVIADNKLALNSSWDDEALRLEIEHLAELDFDLGLLGFDEVELESILDISEELDTDYEPDEGIDYQEAYSVVVICEDAADQEARYKQLTQLGMECKVLVN